MFKKFFFLVTIFKALICLAQTSIADVEVIYNSKIVKDSLNKFSSFESEYILLYNNNESIYYSTNEKQYYDSLLNGGSVATIQTSMGNIPKFPKSRGQVYKNNGVIYTTLPIGFYNYEFIEPTLIWEILPDRKKINDINCQLAKTVNENGETFFAWFAPDIISNEGPFRFKGLAGLILEVYNKNKTIEITAIEIKKSLKEMKKIPYFRLLKIEDKNKFLQTRKNFIENPSVYMGNMEVFDVNGNDITRKKMEKFKKENVFLD